MVSGLDFPNKTNPLNIENVKPWYLQFITIDTSWYLMIPPYKYGIFTAAQDTRGEAQDLLRLAVVQQDSTKVFEAIELLSSADAPWPKRGSGDRVVRRKA